MVSSLFQYVDPFIFSKILQTSHANCFTLGCMNWEDTYNKKADMDWVTIASDFTFYWSQLQTQILEKSWQNTVILVHKLFVCFE
jgi:hypothetical protein